MAGVRGAPGGDVGAWIGRQLQGRDGPIGAVVGVYLDEESGQPEWLAVATDGDEDRLSFVPLDDELRSGGDLAVPYLAEEAESAPKAATAGALTRQEEAELYEYFGVSPRDEHYGVSPRAPAATDAVTRPTEPAMTRSEEELHVSKTSAEAGRVRLRKWVETETVSERVPIVREEVRIERQPITDENVDQAMTGAEISEAEYEVVLHEEQVTVAKVTVPKERVRVEKDVVVDDQEVSAELRKERIEVEHDGPR